MLNHALDYVMAQLPRHWREPDMSGEESISGHISLPSDHSPRILICFNTLFFPSNFSFISQYCFTYVTYEQYSEIIASLLIPRGPPPLPHHLYLSTSKNR